MLFLGIKYQEVVGIWEEFGEGKEYVHNILHEKNSFKIIMINHWEGVEGTWEWGKIAKPFGSLQFWLIRAATTDYYSMHG